MRPNIFVLIDEAYRTTGGDLGDYLMASALADYVIVHELRHFSVPNHGKLWKSLMRAHLGDFEGLEDKLKQSAGRSAKSVTSAR